jgi:uncharacterized paraquat-inducible protein A
MMTARWAKPSDSAERPRRRHRHKRVPGPRAWALRTCQACGAQSGFPFREIASGERLRCPRCGSDVAGEPAGQLLELAENL